VADTTVADTTVVDTTMAAKTLVGVASDWRSLLPGTSAGLLQLMYPHLGRGVVEHSAFFSDPFGRIYRSIPQIWATLLTPDTSRGRRIRDLHRGISGVDEHGSRYHALDPETFWWAHATFTRLMFQSVELFHTIHLTADQQESLYQETVAWYAGYGVSMRPVPADYRAFMDRFDQICGEQLQLTAAAARAVAMAQAGDIHVPGIPSRLIRPMRPVLGPLGRTLAFGCLPAVVRQRFEIPWGRSDQLRFRIMCEGLRGGFRLVPTTANHSTLQWTLRNVGARTRAERYSPAA
jgi:uncharacterized protein (DUF2236 family)